MGITVLLADSVVDVRQIERKLLQKELYIEIVGEAADEPEAMMLIKSLGRFLPSKSNLNTQEQRFSV